VRVLCVQTPLVFPLSSAVIRRTKPKLVLAAGTVAGTAAGGVDQSIKAGGHPPGLRLYRQTLPGFAGRNEITSVDC